MPEIRVADQCFSVEAGSNLLDALLAQGLPVAHSCRAGSCQSCLLRCSAGEPQDAQPDALSPERRAQGWRLACQCRVVDDLDVALFDPVTDGVSASVQACDWLSPSVLRLRLLPERPLRYRAGQHLQLWIADQVGRPYSLASLASSDAWLEFHVDCSRAGAFCDRARALQSGDELRVGAVLGGALHYNPEWQELPLLLLALGTGLAPLWAVLREALRQTHNGPIRLVHVARSACEHYLAQPLLQLQREHGNLQVELYEAAQLQSVLAQLRLVPKPTRALLCGDALHLDELCRRLYLAGLPRSQIFSDCFLAAADR